MPEKNYEVREEEMEGVVLRSAYNRSGHYIGSEGDAHALWKRGIDPELADNDHNVCSIGFCVKEKKWYGWSHRAIFGFGIGHIVKDGDCGAAALPAAFMCHTLADCKRVAVAFARSVS